MAPGRTNGASDTHLVGDFHHGDGGIAGCHSAHIHTAQRGRSAVSSRGGSLGATRPTSCTAWLGKLLAHCVGPNSTRGRRAHQPSIRSAPQSLSQGPRRLLPLYVPYWCAPVVTDALDQRGLLPQEAMHRFETWLAGCRSADHKPVFVGLNAPFDWSFVNYYFLRFIGRNPFGFTALDIKAYGMGATGFCTFCVFGSEQPTFVELDTFSLDRRFSI